MRLDRIIFPATIIAFATLLEQGANANSTHGMNMNEAAKVLATNSNTVKLGQNCKDITGQSFGRITVLRPAGRNRFRHIMWHTICTCGNGLIVSGKSLRNGKTTSCGCYHRERMIECNTTHGKSDAPEYRAWCGMKSRTLNQNEPNHKHYGGRGITVSDRWMRSFPDFLLDMGPRPSPKHSIDRINNDGNYEPGNCRWATQREQCNNKRSNRRLKYNGEHLTISEWARRFGIRPQSIIDRLDRLGWTIEAALTSPIIQHKLIY